MFSAFVSGLLAIWMKGMVSCSPLHIVPGFKRLVGRLVEIWGGFGGEFLDGGAKDGALYFDSRSGRLFDQVRGCYPDLPMEILWPCGTLASNMDCA